MLHEAEGRFLTVLPKVLDCRHYQPHPRQPGAIVNAAGGTKDQPSMLLRHLKIPKEFCHHAKFIVPAERKGGKLAVYDRFGHVPAYLIHHHGGAKVYACQV